MRISGTATALVFIIGSAVSAQVVPTTGPTEPKPRQQLVNVELSERGTLDGQVVDSAGTALNPSGLRFRTKDAVVAVRTDAAGRFSILLPHGGVCVLEIDGTLYACRAWQHGTAPPGSISRLALIDGVEPIVRGQWNDNCDDCAPQQRRGLRPIQKYGLAITALGGTAVYVALARENISE